MDIRQVTETIAMIEEQNFDIRTITMGISLLDCIDTDIEERRYLRMAIFYEVSDIKLEIDNRSKGYDDLNEWARNVATSEDLNAIKRVTKDAMLGVRTSLTNRMAFHGTFSMSMKTYISFELPAPMGVNITSKGLSVTPNLFINPLWLIYKLGRKVESAPGVGDGGEFVDSTTFVDTATILYHEMCHILWEHPGVYETHSKNGLHEIVNLATDTQINQDPLIANNKNVTDYGVTLEKMKKMWDLPNLKANESSGYYFEEFMKVFKEQQKQQQNQKCPYCQQQEQQNSQGQNQNQNQDQNGQGNGQGHCTCGQQHGQGNGMGSGQGNGLDDHNTWYKTPSDVTTDSGDEIGQIASSKDSRTAVADIVKRVSQDPIVREKINPEKIRGLMAGGLYDQAIEGKSEKGKLPLKTVLQRGIGRLKAGERRTFSKIYKHQGNRPVIKKGKKRLWNKNIRVFLDNSGSMGTFEISWATMEVAAIAKAIKANLSIIPFDTVVYSENEQVIPKSGKFSFIPTGRGGTSFQPVFDYMKEVGVTNQNDVVIIISDGYGESRIDNYGFRNVIWVMVESKTNTLSVREQDTRGHLVAYLEDDYRYKIEKIGQ